MSGFSGPFRPLSGTLEYAISVNFNVATTDTQIAIPLPAGVTRYNVSTMRIHGASASLTTATIGLFTAAGGSGTIVADSAITVATASENTNTNSMSLSASNANTQAYTAAALFIRVGTAQGSAATGIVVITIIPLLSP